MLGRPVLASDIYALGVIAYELLTGHLPFEPETPYQMLDLQRAGLKAKPRDLRPAISEAAEAAILKALSYPADARFKSAKEFGDALADALTNAEPLPELVDQKSSGEQSVAVNHSTDEASGPERRRKYPLALPASKRAFALSLIGSVAVIAIVLLLMINWRSKPITVEAKAERRLSYSLTMQKDPKRYPASKPMVVFSETIFEPGDQVRLNVSSPQDGYLYIINERPPQADGLPRFSVLYPSMTSNYSADVRAEQIIQIPHRTQNPEKDWFVFDEEEGKERLLLIWSKSAIELADPMP